MKVLILSLIIVVVDQVTKLYVKGFSVPFTDFNHKGLRYGQPIPVLDNVFNFTFIENPGIAFGMHFGPMFKVMVPIVSLIITGIIIYTLWKVRNDDILKRISLALLLGGAIGNLIDRIFYGYLFDYAPMFHGKVVDFFDLKLYNGMGNYIFNVADIAVFIGLAFFISAFNKKKEVFVEKKEEEIAVPNP